MTLWLEHLRAKMRPGSNHLFRVIKQQFGFQKTRYRRLAKNSAEGRCAREMSDDSRRRQFERNSSDLLAISHLLPSSATSRAITARRSACFVSCSDVPKAPQHLAVKRGAKNKQWCPSNKKARPRPGFSVYTDSQPGGLLGAALVEHLVHEQQADRAGDGG